MRYFSSLLAVCVLLVGPAAAQDGPVLDLPKDGETPSPAKATSGAVIGGYGQFTFRSLKVGPDADFDNEANIRRLVLLVGYKFEAGIEVYTELEWEDVISCATCEGAVEVEQAFLDWHLLDEALTLRAGLILVPAGIINVWHEPPVFHGVFRPGMDTSVIPSTWRELAIGVKGRLDFGLGYELYLMTAPDPTALGPGGLPGSLSLGAQARVGTVAVALRVEYEPTLGLLLGLWGYGTDLAGNADLFDANGTEVDTSLPLIGWGFDAKLKRWGVEARAVWAQLFFPEAGRLLRARNAEGNLYYPNAAEVGPVPTRMDGGYVELGYDVFWPVPSISHELVPFIRFELYDTQAAVPDGFAANELFSVMELTTGLSYRPIEQVVFKFDVQLRDRSLGLDELQINLGGGYMF